MTHYNEKPANSFPFSIRMDMLSTKFIIFLLSSLQLFNLLLLQKMFHLIEVLFTSIRRGVWMTNNWKLAGLCGDGVDFNVHNWPSTSLPKESNLVFYLLTRSESISEIIGLLPVHWTITSQKLWGWMWIPRQLSNRQTKREKSRNQFCLSFNSVWAAFFDSLDA